MGFAEEELARLLAEQEQVGLTDEDSSRLHSTEMTS